MTIPDANFVAYLQSVFPSCMNGNLMDTTCSEIVNATNLSFGGYNFYDLTGTQYFDSLDTLIIGHNQIASLPPFPNSLTYLDCSLNILTSLPVLPNTLTHLECPSNQLTYLPPLPNSLTFLDCQHNLITSLPILPNSLTALICHSNSLTYLPTLPNSLSILGCGFNSLTSLPSLPSSLSGLHCFSNSITSLPDLPNSLTALSCYNNSLTNLPILPNSINTLDCYNNLLTNLPTLPSTLYSFTIQNNPGILCMPPLQNFTGPSIYFNISNTGITCLPNTIQHAGYMAQIDTMPICDVFNTNGCEVSWNIKGNIVLDGDGSCTSTNDGTGTPMIKMNLYDSGNNVMQQEIANWGGDYSFDTQLGIYSTSVDTLNLSFNILCPSNNSVASNLTTIDSMDYNVDFRLVCKSGFDIGAWNVFRHPNFFPGNINRVHVLAGDFVQSIYNVSCNSGISGEVKVVINGPANYLSPLAGALIPIVNGDTLIYSIADFSLVNANSDFAFNVITDITAQIGDEICFDVTVTPTAGDNNISNNTLTHCFAVNNSYDPNEKEVSPVGSLAYPYNDWLTYTIHFQNTGTAAAQHIQILDTLDADLDASTFQLLSYSFAPLVQITGSNVAFDFININLPDSGTDLTGSQGYVSYRVKPLLNLPFGSFIQNTASIYFDFNSPVVTNTVSNLICNPTTSTTTATICEGDTYFFEGSTLTVAGNYSVTLQSVIGCDSIINLNLIVDPAVTNSIAQSICSGITFNFNGQQLSSSGIYHDTLTAITGCDSIVNLSLIVLPALTSSINQTICAGDSINFNGTMLDTTGIYADTLLTLSGCDSIVTLHLSLINAVTHSISANICQGDTLNFNGALLTSTGTYYDTLSAVTNCDSIVVMHLNAHELNASIILNGNTFTATGLGIIQWINCDSGSFVPNAIGSTFTPTIVGNYAAWVWDGLCSDTTECVFDGLTGGNGELLIENNFVVFPNPTDENITVQLLQSSVDCNIEILNTLGQILFSEIINDKSETINLKSFSSGIYFVKIITADGNFAVKKIVKE
ncbi:hypothetical protein LBMAG27_05050 [Bacteroidota bacterium]|nr:hypothetical protein LBMAG27_05050 [Bacteroidota bacterium]